MVTPPIADNDTRITKGETNVAGVLSRRHAWSSRAALLDMMKKRYPWKIWDERIFEAYLVSLYSLYHGVIAFPHRCRNMGSWSTTMLLGAL